MGSGKDGRSGGGKWVLLLSAVVMAAGGAPVSAGPAKAKAQPKARSAPAPAPTKAGPASAADDVSAKDGAAAPEGPAPEGVRGDPINTPVPHGVKVVTLAPYAPEGSPKPPADPRNLEGVWVNTFFVTNPFTTITGEPAPYKAEAQNILHHRRRMSTQGTPVAEPGFLCRPPGLTRDMNEGSPFTIVQGSDKVVFLTEEGHSVRIVWLNQQHPKDLKPSYLGHSIGHWEGNTLVIDTIGFNGLAWIDYAGSPASDKLHIVERIRRVDIGGPFQDLQAVTTIDDPTYYTAPWTYMRTYRWRPEEMVSEYNCEENMRPESMEGVQVENPALLGKGS